METESKTKTGKLVIVRHHESEWNKLGLWTGLHDSHLTSYGKGKSEEMGTLVKDICFDVAFTSKQIRCIQTLSSMLLTCTADEKLPLEHIAALNERDYGDYTGKNKWDVQKAIGDEEFNKLRREWDYPPPNGESLKMVYERVVPFYLERVVPLLLEGKNVVLVSHGNTIRALTKYIESIPDEEMVNVVAPFGGIIIYDVDENGRQISKEVRMVESQVNA